MLAVGNIKRCPRCSTWKHTDKFYICSRNPDKLNTHCKVCVNAYNKTYYKKRLSEDPESLRRYWREFVRKWRHTPKGHAHKRKRNASECERRARFKYDRSEKGQARYLKRKALILAAAGYAEYCAFLKSKRDVALFPRFSHLAATSCAYSHLGECSGAVEDDHKTPIIKNGDFLPQNMHRTCRHHNRSKGRKTHEEFLKYWETERVARI